MPILTIAWNFVKPYLSNVFFWIILALVIAVGVQSFRCYVKDNKITVLDTKLTAANDKLASQKAEFDKLKLFADAQDAKLKQAYIENREIEQRHAKTIETIMKSELPDTASCEDTAKWARDIARRHK